MNSKDYKKPRIGIIFNSMYAKNFAYSLQERNVSVCYISC